MLEKPSLSHTPGRRTKKYHPDEYSKKTTYIYTVVKVDGTTPSDLVRGHDDPMHTIGCLAGSDRNYVVHVGWLDITYLRDIQSTWVFPKIVVPPNHPFQ